MNVVSLVRLPTVTAATAADVDNSSRYIVLAQTDRRSCQHVNTEMMRQLNSRLVLRDAAQDVCVSTATFNIAPAAILLNRSREHNVPAGRKRV